MEPRSSKLQHQQKNALQTWQQQTGLEFASVEDMLRYDAAHTAPPDSVAERLAGSIAREPRPIRSWWRRFFPRKPPTS
jgi:hypothetical protein